MIKRKAVSVVVTGIQKLGFKIIAGAFTGNLAAVSADYTVKVNIEVHIFYSGGLGVGKLAGESV